MSGYKTYRFKDKDPVIDLLRTAWQAAEMRISQLSLISGVSEGAIRAWFFGKTRRPQYASVQAVARALRHEFRMMRVKS